MRKLIFKLLQLSGIPYLFREVIQRNKVTILLFHEISKEVAVQSFLFLTRKYNIIDLNDYLEAYNKKDKTKIPKKALIITFDDGFFGNYELLPIIIKYNIPLTIFLCASIINTNRHYWFKFNNQSISTTELKFVPNIKKLKMLAKVGFDQTKEYDEPQALQKEQIDEMKDYVNMQSHTLYHPCLPNCDDNEAHLEIFNSKKILESKYGLEINAISYPNGDYSERDISFAKKAGYKLGITLDYGFNNINADLFRLKRISVNDTDDINELAVKASGLWGFLKTIIGKQMDGYKKNV